MLVGEAARDRGRVLAAERVAHVSEVGAGADHRVGQVVARERLPQRLDAVVHHRPLVAPPVAEVLHAEERRVLADARRANRDAIHRLGDLVEKRAARDHRPDPVAGETVDLGKAVQVHQRFGPVGAREQPVRRPLGVEEVAVGLVDHQGDSRPPRDLEEPRDDIRRVDRAGRVVGGHQHDRPRARAETGLGIRRVGHAAALGPERQRHGAHAHHRKPHLMIEVIGSGKNDLVAGPGERRQRQAERLVATGGDAHLPGRDHAAIEFGAVLGERGAQLGESLDVGVARGFRARGRVGQVRGQRLVGRVAGHRLGDVEERLVGGKRAALDPRLRLGDGRGGNGREQRIDGIRHRRPWRRAR